MKSTRKFKKSLRYREVVREQELVRSYMFAAAVFFMENPAHLWGER